MWTRATVAVDSQITTGHSLHIRCIISGVCMDTSDHKYIDSQDFAADLIVCWRSIYSVDGSGSRDPGVESPITEYKQIMAVLIRVVHGGRVVKTEFEERLPVRSPYCSAEVTFFKVVLASTLDMDLSLLTANDLTLSYIDEEGSVINIEDSADFEEAKVVFSGRDCMDLILACPKCPECGHNVEPPTYVNESEDDEASSTCGDEQNEACGGRSDHYLGMNEAERVASADFDDRHPVESMDADLDDIISMASFTSSHMEEIMMDSVPSSGEQP
eukprot:Clim_evm51s246 gene=Clim_evmTU51s246